MSRYTHLTDEQRTAASVMAPNGARNREIAEVVGVKKETVAKVAARARRTGLVVASVSSVRGPILGPRDCLRLLRLFQHHADLKLARIVILFNVEIPQPVSIRAAQRPLFAAGVRALRRRSKPFFSTTNRANELAQAKIHRGWKEEWRSVCLTDESSLVVKSGSRSLFLSRRGAQWRPKTSHLS